MADERRQHERVEVDWPARIGRKGLGVVAARIKDASIGGVYLVTTLSVPLGENVLIEIPIRTSAGEKRSLAHGKVARRQELSDGKIIGYGVQFLKLDDDALEYLLTTCV